MSLSLRGGFGAFLVLLLASAGACGGKVGAEGPAPSPITTATGTATTPPPGSDAGVSPRQVVCKSGSASLAKFAGERAGHVAVALDTGVVVFSSQDATDKVHVRALRDAAKGPEELSVHSGGATAVAASGRRIAYADDKGVVVVSVPDGARITIPVAAPVRFLGLRDTDAFVVTDAGLARYPLTAGGAAGPEQAVCIGPTCGVAGIAGFDVRGAALAVVSTDGALYVGTDVGLRRAGVAVPGPVAVGSGFIAFIAPNAGPKLPSLGLFRPLDEEVELFALPVTKGACGPGVDVAQVDVLGLASDGARLAFNTKESYACAEAPASAAFTSKAARPDLGALVAGASGAVAVALDDVCVYALLGGPDVSLVSFESPAR